MKTSHLIILLILFWCLAMYVNNPMDIEECFAGEISNKKNKMTRSIMNEIAGGGKSGENINLNRFQKLYNSGRCTPFLAPKIKGLSKREVLGRKLCYCRPEPGKSIGNGWILAKNMPLGSCSKYDFTRG